jgi:hypothetical protein
MNLLVIFQLSEYYKLSNKNLLHVLIHAAVTNCTLEPEWIVYHPDLMPNFLLFLCLLTVLLFCVWFCFFSCCKWSRQLWPDKFFWQIYSLA